jgi:hypothetical protein
MGCFRSPVDTDVEEWWSPMSSPLWWDSRRDLIDKNSSLPSTLCLKFEAVTENLVQEVCVLATARWSARPRTGMRSHCAQRYKNRDPRHVSVDDCPGRLQMYSLPGF